MVNSFRLLLAILISSLVLFTSGCDQPKSSDTGGKYKILIIAPLTGPGSELGYSSRTGMEMALEDLGLNSPRRNIELIFQDSRTDPKTALSIFSSRDLHKAGRIVISEMSGVTRALVEPSRQAEVLLLATLVGVPNIGGGSPFFARVNVMSDAIAPPLARFAASQHNKVACLYLNDDYGRGNFELFKKVFEQSGGKVVIAEAFPNEAIDVRVLVRKITASGVKATFVAGYGPTYIALFRAFKEIAPDIQVYADIGIVNTPIFQALGSATEGVYVAATEIDEYPATTERAKVFHQRYSKIRPGQRPDYVTAYSYDTIRVLSEALQAVGSDDPARIRDYLFSRTFTGYGGRFRYNPATGDSVYDDLSLFQIRQGKIMRVTAPH